MRILVVLNDLDIGGAQNYTISLMNEFVKRGHAVSLRVLSNNLLLKERLHDDIELKIWPRNAKIDLYVIKKIRLDIKDGNFDAIISSYIIYQKIAALGIKKKIKTIYPLHSTMEKDTKSFILNFITFRFKRELEIFLTSIDSQTNYFRKIYKLNTHFFKQIYNGIDVEKFTLPPESFCRAEFLLNMGIDPQNKIILMVAGFREEKRHVDAFNAFKRLQGKRKDVSLICVGDNRLVEKNVLQEYVTNNDIRNIKFLSAAEAGDVRNYYWCAELFTLTSNKVETFPISVLEAMASGLPCVLTNVGGNKDIIMNELYGKIVAIEDTHALAEAWGDLLNMQICKKDIRDYIVTNYSLNKSVNEYLKLMME